MDDLVRHTLDATRIRWAERATDASWHTYLRKTAALAYRGRAPRFTSVRVHSVPGTHWEIVGRPSEAGCVVADDELTATLCELAMLSSPTGSVEAGFDRAVVMLADGFRSIDDRRRFAACMGWALPRATELARLRVSAFQAQGSTAPSIIVLLHELAHQCVANDQSGWTKPFVAICEEAVDMLVVALSKGELREKALADGQRLGLEPAQATKQIADYVSHVHANPLLLQELVCDLLASIGFLNLRSDRDLFDDIDAGPSGMNTREVGDALFVIHGTLQNLQLVASVRAIANSVTTSVEAIHADRVLSELTARSTAAANVFSRLLECWCLNGALADEWAVKIAQGHPALLASIKHRNTFRSRFLLDPIQELDGVLLEGFADFEKTARAHLTRAGASGADLDARRWALATVDVDNFG